MRRLATTNGSTYKFRIDLPKGKFRNVSTVATSEDEAVQIIEAQEEKYATFLLDPSRATELERALRAGTLSPQDKARIFAHHQDKPHNITRRLI
jgi:hypothetical protein